MSAQMWAPAPVAAPYVTGDRVQITGPDASNYTARIEQVVPDSDGYRIVAAVTAPRRYRDQIVITRVDAHGSSAHLRPEPPAPAPVSQRGWLR